MMLAKLPHWLITTMRVSVQEGTVAGVSGTRIQKYQRRPKHTRNDVPNDAVEQVENEYSAVAGGVKE